MTVLNKENEQQQDDSAELFTLTRSDNVKRYTSYHRNLVFNGETYVASVISRTAFARKLTSSPATISITAPTSDVFEMFKAGTPVLPVSVQIDKFFFSEPGNSLMIFKGSVRTVTLKGQYCGAQCASIGHELERKVPHVTYQPFCNNSLFDARCGLSKLRYKIGIKVDSWVSDDQRGFYYTDGFNDALGESSFDKPYTYLQMGYVLFGEQKRFITRNTVAVTMNPAPPPGYIFKRYVVMHYPINGLEIGDTLAVYPGCNKDPATCVGTYDNLENFVGFPYIPTLSPVKWGLKVDTE